MIDHLSIREKSIITLKSSSGLSAGTLVYLKYKDLANRQTENLQYKAYSNDKGESCITFCSSDPRQCITLKNTLNLDNPKEKKLIKIHQSSRNLCHYLMIPLQTHIFTTVMPFFLRNGRFLSNSGMGST